jgi:hypothetical protein
MFQIFKSIISGVFLLGKKNSYSHELECHFYGSLAILFTFFGTCIQRCILAVTLKVRNQTQGPKPNPGAVQTQGQLG